jgi:hypothetical protein
MKKRKGLNKQIYRDVVFTRHRKGKQKKGNPNLKIKKSPFICYLLMGFFQIDKTPRMKPVQHNINGRYV